MYVYTIYMFPGLRLCMYIQWLPKMNETNQRDDYTVFAQFVFSYSPFSATLNLFLYFEKSLNKFLGNNQNLNKKVVFILLM